MSQKITKLEVNNFIGITEATIEPKKMTVISGKNGRGKTSIVESIRAAFRGAGADKIKVGATKAEIFVSTDEIEVRRRITAAGSTVTVKKIGSKDAITKPQAYLDGIIGDFSFEPVRFFTMDTKEQTEYLLKAIPVKATIEQLKTWTRGLLSAVDGFVSRHGLEAISLAEGMLYDMRAADNSRVKTLEAAISEIQSKLPAALEPFKPAEMQTVLEQISASREFNGQREGIQDRIKDLDNTRGALHFEMNDLESKITDKKDQFTSVNDTASRITLIEISPLEAKRAEIVKALAEVDEEISRAKNNNHRKEESKTKIIYLSESIADLEKSAAAVKGKLEDVQAQQNNLNLRFNCMRPMEIEPLEARLAQLKSAQVFQRDFDRISDMRSELKTVKESAEAKDKAVKTLQTTAPTEMLAAAKMPVEGLAYSGGQFTLHGVPIQNLSTSEKARLAVAVTRNLNKDYPIRAICLDGFESLDTETQKAFMEEAASDDFQYFITKVSDMEMDITTSNPKEEQEARKLN